MRFKSFDGQTISALVYRPAGIAADFKTPVIMDIHGGPEGQSRPSWNVGAQYFAGVLGATVILPNVRGSTGYGKRYADLDNAEKREDSVKDIGALLDWIAKQPNLDTNRVAVYGQSYGGYMSLAVSTHYADRLVGSVERYGISDFASFLKNTEAYRRDNRRAEYGDERDAKMQAVFKRIAPLANVAKITKPMLVMQGANDPRVPKSESDQVVAGIRANGVETWYVVFADEGHGFLKKPNNDLRREVETVFLRKLFSNRGRSGSRAEARPTGSRLQPVRSPDVDLQPAPGRTASPAGSRRSCARSATSVRRRSPLRATCSPRCRTRAAAPWSRRTARRPRAACCRAQLHCSRCRHQPYDRAHPALGRRAGRARASACRCARPLLRGHRIDQVFRNVNQDRIEHAE